MVYANPPAGKQRENKVGAAVPDAAALTSTAAAGANPTKAEYDALRADLVAVRSTLNTVLARLRASGQITP